MHSTLVERIHHSTSRCGVESRGRLTRRHVVGIPLALPRRHSTNPTDATIGTSAVSLQSCSSQRFPHQREKCVDESRPLTSQSLSLSLVRIELTTIYNTMSFNDKLDDTELAHFFDCCDLSATTNEIEEGLQAVLGCTHIDDIDAALIVVLV